MPLPRAYFYARICLSEVSYPAGYEEFVSSRIRQKSHSHRRTPQCQGCDTSACWNNFNLSPVLSLLFASHDRLGGSPGENSWLSQKEKAESLDHCVSSVPQNTAHAFAPEKIVSLRFVLRETPM
jgi:hypothetical protein